MRVDVMRGCRAVEEGFALLPVLAHGTPGRLCLLHQHRVILLSLLRRKDLLALFVQHKSLIGHMAIGGDDGVADIRCDGFFQRRFFVGGNRFIPLLLACYQYKEACGK